MIQYVLVDDVGPHITPMRNLSGTWVTETSDQHRTRVLAVAGSRVVGSFCYVMERHRETGQDCLFASGTFVAARWRRKGIALAMWLHALSLHRPRVVSVDVCSPAGKALARAARRKSRTRVLIEDCIAASDEDLYAARCIARAAKRLEPPTPRAEGRKEPRHE